MSPCPWCNQLSEGHREATATASASCSTIPAGTSDTETTGTGPALIFPFEGPG